MKISLSLGLTFTAASMLAACSSDSGTPRSTGGTGTTTTAGTGGQTASSGGTGGTGTGGTGTGGTGAGGAPANLNLGAALTIAEDGTITDEAGTTGIANGGPAISSSTNMVVPASLTTKVGGLCFKGTTATVPDTSSYGTYWGAQLGLDLKRVPAAGAAPAPVADAGADAGPAGMLVAADWPEGRVIGFAYTLVGNDTVAADKGVPAAHFRFKALPAGANSMNDNYCSNRTPVSGVQETVLFSEINFECWAMGNFSLADDPIQYAMTPQPAETVGTRPNPKALQNIAWQIASDIMVDPIAFDFCVTDLRPILAP